LEDKKSVGIAEGLAGLGLNLSQLIQLEFSHGALLPEWRKQFLSVNEFNFYYSH